MAMRNGSYRRQLLQGSKILGLLLVCFGFTVIKTEGFRAEPPEDAIQVPLDTIQVPLSESWFLQDVVEPISMGQGSVTAGSDDHWMVLTFHDSQKVKREVKFFYSWTAPGGTPEYKQILWLGEQVLIGGRQEKAFLGLLQRWYRDDPAAQELWRRAQRGDLASSKDPLAFLTLSESQRAKIIAGRFLQVLHGRRVVDPANE